MREPDDAVSPLAQDIIHILHALIDADDIP